MEGKPKTICSCTWPWTKNTGFGVRSGMFLVKKRGQKEKQKVNNNSQCA